MVVSQGENSGAVILMHSYNSCSSYRIAVVVNHQNLSSFTLM